MSAGEPALARGTKVGDFLVEHVVGSGGVAVVYLAVDPRFGKRAAVKVLRKVHADDERAVERFAREARAAAELSHPGIVEVFGFGYLDDGRPYLLMSFLEGTTLREICDRGPMPEARAWRHLRQVAEALAYAHARGVVHRDIKPDNLFVHGDATRILDFGVASLDALFRSSAEADELRKLTAAGTPIGTPAYMAPEQWWGETPTPATDQYAFGVTLFEAIAGRLPFVESQFAALLQAHLHAAPPKLVDLVAGVRPEVDAFVGKLMAKRGEDRFADFEAVLDAGDRLFGEDEDRRARPLHGAVDGVAATTTQRADASLAMAPTVLGPSLGGTLRPLAVAMGSIAAGSGALVVTGYAGPHPHAVAQWIRDAGWGAIGIVAGTAIGVGLVAWGTRERARGRAVPIAAATAVLLPLVTAVWATAQSWAVVVAAARGREPGNAFLVLHQGMYESSTGRFLGFGLAASLALGLFGGLRAAGGRTQRPRGARLLVAAGFTVATVTSAFVAPAAILPLSFASLLFLLRAIFADANVDLRAHGESLFAGASAIAFATLVAWTKVDAARAYLWAQGLTRSARVEALMASEHAVAHLLAAGLVGAALFVATEVRFARRRGLRLGALVAAALAVAVPLALDFTFYTRFQAARAASVSRLSGTFALFANLVPPQASSERLPSPEAAPALHVTRDTLALAGEGIARLAALDGPEVRQNVLREISHAVAAERLFGGPDLAVVVDGRLHLTVVARVLELARQAGAVHVELLLLRGEAVEVPVDAPPEAAQLLPSDFAALPVRLERGAIADDDRPSPEVVATMQRDYAGDALVLHVSD